MSPMTAVPKAYTSMTEPWMGTLGNDRCSRCNGLMIAEWSDELSDYTGRRCVLCGESIDPVVLHNRWLQRTGAVGPGEK